MSEYESQQGALERLNIPVETTPPDGIMTSGQARSVRFRVSRPQGYAFGDVESFLFEHIQPTLDWYANALHQRDLAVHKLGEIVDKLEVDLQNLAGQLDNKQYNEAIGLAVDESEKGDETEFMLARIKDLESEIARLQQDQSTIADAPIIAPDGEYYSREEVEGFIATAVAEAEANKDAEFANAGYFTQAQVEGILAEATQTDAIYSQAQLDTLIADAVAKIPTPEPSAPEGEHYSRDEVEGFIATAVADAAEHKQAEIDAAVAQAVNDTPSGYTQDQVDSLISEAEARKEQEVLDSLPAESKPLDQIDALTDEGDLKLRAEVKTLRSALSQMDTYTKELESYIAQVEGRPEPVATPVSTISGRPLPKIRPEDL